jgi:hypothetical protein
VTPAPPAAPRSVYIDVRGQQLGPPKTDGAHGERWRMPTVVNLLAQRREDQAAERAAVPGWQSHTNDAERRREPLETRSVPSTARFRQRCRGC